jgi:hypothetical protein
MAQKVLFIGTVYPGHASILGKRLLNMLQILSHNNYETFFGFTQNLDDQELKFLRQFESIKRLDWRDMDEQEFSRSKSFDVVVFQGAEMELKFGHMFHRMKKKTLRILDLFDSQGLIDQRVSWLKSGEATLENLHHQNFKTEVLRGLPQGKTSSRSA